MKSIVSQYFTGNELLRMSMHLRIICCRAFFWSLFFSLVFLFCALPSQAAPSLPNLFSDHMVMQRDAPLIVWGWAEPGEAITVTIANEQRKTSADSSGRWRVELPPMKAGGPFALTVRGKKTIVVKDVLIGEVWLASGQSNMVFELSHATGGVEEAARANHPNIRFFTVPKKLALQPQADTPPAKWRISSPESAKDFSAVSYFFAVDLQNKLDVPVGIILSAWSGSSAEEWASPESLRGKPVLQPILQDWEASPPAAKSFAAHPTPFQIDFDDFELLPADSSASGPFPIANFDEGLARTTGGGGWSYDWENGAGTAYELVWPGRGGHGFAVRVSGVLDGANASYLQATYQSGDAPANLGAYQGVRFWARGNGAFQFQSLQPTISDWDNFSSTIFFASPDWKPITILFKDLKQAGWGVWAPFTPEALSGFKLMSMTTAAEAPRPPSGMFQGMIAPLAPFQIRGAIWYQGESNALRAHQYRTLLPAVIESWRALWNEGNFPFLIVQLPNHGSSPELGDSAWAELREAQLLTAKSVPQTGLAVTIDLGDAGNVHPPRKREVGGRLAALALGSVYGEKIVSAGPIFDSAEISGEKIIVHFVPSGSSLEIHGGDALKGFSIAGADRKFHWADARIEGATVVVRSADVSSPAAVRYDWANDPAGNLSNGAGLPASPFRSDDWPGATLENR
jgi:sialate O-acetylesterase